MMQGFFILPGWPDYFVIVWEVSNTSKASLRCAKISAFPAAKHKQALPFATKKAFPACGGKGF